MVNNFLMKTQAKSQQRESCALEASSWSLFYTMYAVIRGLTTPLTAKVNRLKVYYFH